MIRRSLVRLAVETPGRGSPSYDDTLKPTKLTRGIDFRYSKESQHLHAMNIESRSGGFRRIKDIMKDKDKIQPALLSQVMDLPNRVSDSGEDTRTREELAEEMKNRHLPLKKFVAVKEARVPARPLTAKQLRAQEDRREYWRTVAWIFLWMLIGSQTVHVILTPVEDVPLLTPEELAAPVPTQPAAPAQSG